jgi:hypothetical protein
MEFVDQPPRASGQGRRPPQARLEALQLLREHPDQWALYEPSEGDPFTSPRTITQQVQKGTGGFTPRGAWKASVRGTDVYLKYVGGKK